MHNFLQFISENRVDFLKKSFLDNVRNSREYKASDWSQVLNSDPSRKKLYLQWILKMIFMDNTREFLRKEDLYKVTENLIFYDKHKNKLQARERDINSFKTYRNFLDVSDKLSDEKSGKEVKADEYQEAIKESTIVYKGPEGSIIIPKTEKASCILGRGTRWCTAAEKNNMFKQYNDSGNLYIITLKNGDKYQFHFEEGIMDAQDREIPMGGFRSKYPWVFKKIKFTEREIEFGALHCDPEVFFDLIDNPSEKIKMLAYENARGYAIAYMDNVSDALFKLAIKEDDMGDNLEYIMDIMPEHLKKEALKRDYTAMQYCSKPSEELQLYALNINTKSYKYIYSPSEKVKELAKSKGIKI